MKHELAYVACATLGALALGFLWGYALSVLSDRRAAALARRTPCGGGVGVGAVTKMQNF